MPDTDIREDKVEAWCSSLVQHSYRGLDVMSS